jgi:hypothetical protein
MNVNVIATAYTTRTQDLMLFDCAAAAACVGDYVRAMAQDCAPGLL